MRWITVSTLLTLWLSLATRLEGFGGQWTTVSHQSEEPGSQRLLSQESKMLNILLFDSNKIFKYDFDAMVKEVASIFEPLGVKLTWRRVSTSMMKRAPGEVIVILHPKNWVKRPANLHVMGAVVTGDNSQRALFIYAHNIARNLGFDVQPNREPTPLQKFHMSQAMGRVIGHELIHAIAPPHPHTTEGLMQPILNRSSLVKSQVKIGKECTDAFLSGLSEWPPRRP